MDPRQAKMRCAEVWTSYRYGWHEPDTGRRGWSAWCTSGYIVKQAIKQIRKDEPTLEIWLETRQRLG